MGAPTALTITAVVCRSCGVPFTRYGAARSSNFYLTDDENSTCICCKVGLDPDTLQPLSLSPVEAEKNWPLGTYAAPV